MSEFATARVSALAAQRWSLPAIEGDIPGARRERAPERNLEREREAAAQERARAAAAEIALLRAQAAIDAETALNAARERGYQEGLKTAQEQMQPQIDQLSAQTQRLEEILTQLSRPLDDLDEQVPQQLSRLAIAVGRQLARRELTADPGQIIALVREAVSRLPAAAREVRVHLNPRDAATVRERLATPAQDRAWTLIEDATLTQGGCMVRSDTSQIDARLESRLNAIAAELFGEARARDRVAESAATAPQTQTPQTNPSQTSPLTTATPAMADTATERPLSATASAAVATERAQ